MLVRIESCRECPCYHDKNNAAKEAYCEAGIGVLWISYESIVHRDCPLRKQAISFEYLIEERRKRDMDVLHDAMEGEWK